MGYLDIDNLYKNQEILNFKEVYALEKIHGTSAHISYKDGRIAFFAGGGSYDIFVKLFDAEKLKTELSKIIFDNKSCIIYGEFYGGKMQGMSATYGKDQKFVVFDINIGGVWLNVPKANSFATSLGLDFVSWNRISTNIKDIDHEKDIDSVQAVKKWHGAWSSS